MSGFKRNLSKKPNAGIFYFFFPLESEVMGSVPVHSCPHYLI